MPAVLVVHPSTELYGADRQLAESVAAFVEAGWDTTVCLPADGELGTLLSGARVEIAPFPVLRKAMLNLRGVLRLVGATPREVSRLVRLIRRVAPDVLYVNTVTIPWWALAGRLTRTPVVVHVHEAEDDLPRAVRLGLNSPLLLARTIIANSQASRQVLVGAIARLHSRVRVIPNGIADPGPPASETGEPARLALVARLSPRKGIDVALEAVALVRASGTDVTLDVCGTTFAGYEWFETELRARAARPDLDGAVFFRGYVDPSSAVLARAGIVLVPSRVEPFGNTAVEGLLAARPVIASDVQGLAEIITDDRTGVLVPPGDAQALADAILDLSADPVRALRLARAGRAAATATYSIERYRQQIVAVATELVKT